MPPERENKETGGKVVTSKAKMQDAFLTNRY